MDVGNIGLRPPIGTGIPWEVPCVLVQHMKRGNTTRPVGIGIALDVGAVLTVTLSFRVRTTTPVTGMNRSWSYDSVTSLKWGYRERGLGLLPKVIGGWGRRAFLERALEVI
jgi:hypothetical protein